MLPTDVLKSIWFHTIPWQRSWEEVALWQGRTQARRFRSSPQASTVSEKRNRPKKKNTQKRAPQVFFYHHLHNPLPQPLQCHRWGGLRGSRCHFLGSGDHRRSSSRGERSCWSPEKTNSERGWNERPPDMLDWRGCWGWSFLRGKERGMQFHGFCSQRCWRGRPKKGSARSNLHMGRGEKEPLAPHQFSCLPWEREREKVREMGCFGDGSCAGNEGGKRAKGRFLNGKGTVTFWAGRWPH